MTETEPGIGHNEPPLYDLRAHASLSARAEALTDEIEAWIKRDIADDEDAEDLRDVLGQVVALKRDAEKQRSADKKPHLDRGREVDAAYQGIGNRLDRLSPPVKRKLEDWLAKLEAARLAKAKAEREAAEAERKEAARLAALAAQTQSIRAQEAAEAAAEAAAKSEKAAARTEKSTVSIRSATGGTKAASYRTRKVATLDDINQAFLHYRDAPELKEFLTRLANADLRAKDGPSRVPGFTVRNEKTVA